MYNIFICTNIVFCYLLYFESLSLSHAHTHHILSDYISFSAHTDYEQTSEFIKILNPPHIVSTVN